MVWPTLGSRMAKEQNKHLYSDTHPFDGLFSMTIWVSQHQKGITILDFNKARDDGLAVASAGPYGNHLHLSPDRYHASASSFNFLQAGCSF